MFKLFFFVTKYLTFTSRYDPDQFYTDNHFVYDSVHLTVLYDMHYSTYTVL